MMKFGVQYYPEHWPEERWQVDAKMMEHAGVNTVRMGEFAWSAYEPEEGNLDFSWMERAIELLGRHGVRTILCTCSRTPPPWVYKSYPGVLNTSPGGLEYHTDGRYLLGLAHPEFIELSQRIDGAVIRNFAGNDNVIAWQVDNEIGARNDCYCKRCREAFQAYLRGKYGTVKALNEAWGVNFWSLSFNDFSEVPIPERQPQLVLEYRRFMSHLNVEFTRWRTDIIHELDPGKAVTTNFQGIASSHTDYSLMSEVIDVNGMNHYPSRTPELSLDYNRASNGTVWVLEQHTRLQAVDTPKGRMRLWAWMAAAHGADAVIFFRWRQCRWGQEQFADGLLPHSGRENRFYEELARMGGEIKQVGELIDRVSPSAQAAIVFSQESRWAVQAGLYEGPVAPINEAVRYHKALARRATSIDALNPREDISKYRLVIAPRLWVVDQEIGQNLRRYVEGGGLLCLTAGSGVVDQYGKSFVEPRPGPLRDLVGITVSDLAFEKNMKLELASASLPGLNATCGHLIADEIHVEDTEVVATYAAGWRCGAPAVVSRSVGEGRVIYIGTLLEQEPTTAVVDWLCELAAVERRIEFPEDVSVYEQVSENARLLFVLNWAEAERSVHIGDGWRDAFTGESVRTVVVPPNDLRLLRCS